ncbi:glutamate ABC transporter substrate-binding protein [Furfurilactobacillus siliginis]|uniref:Glutamine ABC transporter substrate-binding protein n=1 Tax=Furfurilactobacillus siliginis TaxID=348151 RepID=A0A0R2L9F0_9LACO|nr:glutamate ABC transporter substrate-binding protein [Furfurilactobacillus siliginis]KRN96358.1 glutamine ABC transporter, substrate binding protein [Furfurilactobacillus siliginis]GEK29211.1 glutamine ABC transporter substrate-binding protein [Furfurilactobacillus siliginis]
MKKRFRVAALVAGLGVLLLSLSGCGQSLSKQNVLQNDKDANTINWGVKADTKLFGLMDVQDNNIKGFDVDMANHITKHILGKKGKARFIQVTSQSRIPLLKNGNIDAIIATMTITPERQKVVDFSNSYFDAGQSILVPNDSNIHSVKDLNKPGTTVLGVVGANSVQNIKKVAPNARVLELQDYAQALTSLKAGQGEALTTDNGILYGMAVQNPGFKVVGGTFTREPYGVAVNKGQEPFVKAVNKAIKEMEADGEYNALIHKWFGNVPGFNYKELER